MYNLELSMQPQSSPFKMNSFFMVPPNNTSFVSILLNTIDSFGCFFDIQEFISWLASLMSNHILLNALIKYRLQ